MALSDGRARWPFRAAVTLIKTTVTLALYLRFIPTRGYFGDDAPQGIDSLY